MKKSQWRVSALFAVLGLFFAARSSLHLAHLRSARQGTKPEALVLVWWMGFAVRYAIRGIRGYMAESSHARLGQRLQPGTDPERGDPVLAFRQDVLGERIDSFLLFISAGSFAIAAVLENNSATPVLAWSFGILSWLMLVVFLRSFVAPSRFVVSERGIDCRFALPALRVEWEEIVSVRSTGTPGILGSVYVTLSDAAVGRFDTRTRKRMARLAKRKGAHYRWLDSFFFSSAGEVASVVERFRSEPEARRLIASGRWPADLESVSAPALPAAPAPVRPALGPQGRPLTGIDIDRKRMQAGLVAAVGAGVRVLAYFLPWVVATGFRTVTLNGSKAGAPVLSIWFSLAALGLAIAFVAGREELGPRLIVGLGAGAVLASVANFLVLTDTIHRLGSIWPRTGWASRCLRGWARRSS